MATQKQTVRKPIAELDFSIFVRRQLDHKRVLELAELLENEVELDAIEVTEANQGIDGRHRIEAHLLIGRTEIECKVRPGKMTTVELIAAAFQANTGGALPPEQQDKEHTVELLLEQHVAYKTIAGIIGVPLVMARKYIENVKGRTKRKNLQKAALAVTEGSTVAIAAEDNNVGVDELKSFITGAKRKPKTGSIAEIKQAIALNHKSFASKNARLLDKLRDTFSDGGVNALEVRQVFDFADEHLAQYSRTITNRRRRFEAESGEENTPVNGVMSKKKRRAKKTAA